MGSSANPPSKRKQNVAGMSSGGRAVKRRASKACHCCRSRKVRCDVVESGIPCTNCRLDEVECLVTEGKRRRKSYVDEERYQPTQTSPRTVNDTEKTFTVLPLFDNIEGLQDLAAPLGESLKGKSDDWNYDNGGHQPHLLYQTQGHRLSAEERLRRLSAISSSSKSSLVSPLSALCSSRCSSHHEPRLEIVLPACIQPLPSRLPIDDLDYLNRKGAFVTPETSLRNELLRAYVQFVHPYLPLLDLQDFLTSIDKPQQNNKISLLLFQAVMFAGSAYVDMRYLSAQGYTSRKVARKAFFQRVKVLYDFDLEKDRVTVVQAALLMTYWYESPDDPKDVWHWLGIAISLARTIGIDCDTSKAAIPVQTKRLWKRIWWCCFMRDRLVSIGMRRPMRILEKDFDVQMLKIDDFETQAMSAESSRMLGGCPVIRDSSKRVTLAKMCIALVELCRCITEVVSIQYSTLGQKLGATQETTVRLVPRKLAANPSYVMRCDCQLEEWQQSLTPEIRYFTPDTHERVNTHDGDVINLHRALLAGIYLTAVSALHRPQMMPAMPNVIVLPEMQELSRQKVREAANDVTEIFKDLTARNLLRYLPATGVTVILPAIIIHLLDIKSSDPDIRFTSIRKFQSCMRALQRLREIYASADSAFSFLDAAVRRADTHFHYPSLSTRRQSSGAASAPMTVSLPAHERNNAGQDRLPTPPEATLIAKCHSVPSSTTPEVRKLTTTFTPSAAEKSINPAMADGIAINLGEWELSSESDHDETDDLDSSQRFEEQEDERLQKEFDKLINLKATTGPFGSDEGLYDEMNMAWLNGLGAEHEDKYNDGDDVPMFEKAGMEFTEAGGTGRMNGITVGA